MAEYRFDIEQNSPEWDKIRKLKFTASNASTIMANGKGLQTLVKKMLADYYSTGVYFEYSGKYTNPQMDRGHNFEDKARQVYELETGETVIQVGFVQYNDYIGCSPDGLVGGDGLIEIKNHSDEVFLQLVIDGKIDKKYLDQMQMQMFITNRKWCDYFAFNPNFNPCFIRIRQYPDMNKYQELQAGLDSGTEQLKRLKQVLDKKLER